MRATLVALLVLGSALPASALGAEELARSLRALPLPDIRAVDGVTDVQCLIDPAWPLTKTPEQDARYRVLEPGDARRDQLLALLGSADPELRRRAAWGLRLRANLPWGDDTRAIVQAALDPLARDPDPVVRLASLAWGCPMLEHDAQPARRFGHARRLLADEDPLVRHAGLVMLGCGDEPGTRDTDLRRLREIARDAAAPLETRLRAAGLAASLEPTKPEVELLAMECMTPVTLPWCRDGHLALVDPHPPDLAAVTRYLRQLAIVPGPAQAGAEEALRRLEAFR